MYTCTFSGVAMQIIRGGEGAGRGGGGEGRGRGGGGQYEILKICVCTCLVSSVELLNGILFETNPRVRNNECIASHNIFLFYSIIIYIIQLTGSCQLMYINTLINPELDRRKPLGRVEYV